VTASAIGQQPVGHEVHDCLIIGSEIMEGFSHFTQFGLSRFKTSHHIRCRNKAEALQQEMDWPNATAFSRRGRIAYAFTRRLRLLVLATDPTSPL
jgi:hypothetical protein